jgi:XTP/dITP diphosphohydrolase
MPSASEHPLLLATRSTDKAREIRSILQHTFHGNIITLADAGIVASAEEDRIEAFDTFLANADAKAEYFLRRTGLPTLADDSGIQVHALGGGPGVRSRRYAERPDLDGRALDEANNERLLRELAAVPPDRRGARYTCAAVLHLPGGSRFACIGTCTGSILEAPRGASGFGYDPLFLDPATGLSFGETEPAEKNRRSHRARAFRGLAANLPTPPA